MKVNTKKSVGCFLHQGTLLVLLSGGLRAADPVCPPDWIHDAPPAKEPPKNKLGPGAFGANRRVNSPEGIGAVTGHFSDPDFHIYLDPTKRAGAWKSDADPGQNPNSDKPTFYLGAEMPGAVQVDAGMQWEQFEMGSGTLHADQGWALVLFIHSSTWPSCHLWKEPPHRGPYKGLGDTQLVFQINPYGEIQLVANTDKAGQFTIFNKSYQAYWPRLSNSKLLTPGPPVGYVKDLDKIIVKRVVGLTQRTNSVQRVFYDGTYMRNMTFSGGSVAQIHQHVSGDLSLDVWKDWSVEYKNGKPVNVANRYAPTPQEHRNANSQYPWGIDFNSPYKLNHNTGNDPHYSLSRVVQEKRYREETVNINLLPAGHKASGK